MDHAELRKYVRMVLTERIRNAKNASGRRPNTSKFSFSEFKKITDGTERMQYANDRLEFLGEGSSRSVYVLTSKHVLKVANCNAGVAQNKAEVDVFTNPLTKGFVAAIYDFDPKYAWLSSELVVPFEHAEEIERLVPGVTDVGSWEDFVKHAIDDGSNQGYIKQFAPDLVEMANALAELAETNNLMMGDLRKASSWGRGVDGRLVLLDYGYTVDVAEEHYS